ncbi:MAG: hypothetical protein IPN75_17960 [Dechloromonas sp.]|uniref:Enoyl-CoA hydratase/isomerase family protein n=1 Tax=Candidatus Dechloromonas phosphorivorans TaxID=2899244 RepID=A0A9D7LQH2_9RHOO|nr:hypothetical protein [Candidatus Dechloromonas phosphorivorans]
MGWDDPLRSLIREIEMFPAPVIAMIEGSVWGGACETIFACDLIIASPKYHFRRHSLTLACRTTSAATGFLQRGFSPYRLVKEMAFTAKPVSAQRAEQVEHHQPYVVDNPQIEEFTYEMATGITQNARCRFR